MSEQEPSNDRQNERGPSSAGSSLVDLYERMSNIFRDNLERAGTLTEEAFERALKESRDWAGKMRDYYADDIARVSAFIRRDWHDAIRFTRDQTRKSLDLDRLQAGALDVISKMAKTAGEQLEVFANKITDRLSYKTGEIAGAGTLQCTRCEQALTFDKATRIPPCPKCRNTTFRRSF